MMNLEGAKRLLDQYFASNPDCKKMSPEEFAKHVLTLPSELRNPLVKALNSFNTAKPQEVCAMIGDELKKRARVMVQKKPWLN